MRITDAEIYTVRLPTRREHKWATSVSNVGAGYAIIKLITDQGVYGLGEATTMPEWGGDYQQHSGETAVTVAHMIRDYLLPAIRGEHVLNLEGIHARMNRVVKGHPYAKAAIDMACYDAAGKALGVPVHMLLGGCVRSEVYVTHSLGILPIDEAVAEAQAVVGEGIRYIKVKVGLDPDRDVNLVAKLREALGPAVEISIDANQAYRTPAEAVQTVRRMEPYRIRYVEQPVEGSDGLAEVARRIDVPVMADESCWTAYEARKLAEARACTLISVYTTKPGGLSQGRKVAAVAESAGIYCNVNGSAETGVGNAANLHLAASSRVFTEASAIPITAVKGREPTRIACRYFLDDIVREPFVYRDGKVTVPTAPGLGVELDPEKLAQYRIA